MSLTTERFPEIPGYGYLRNAESIFGQRNLRLPNAVEPKVMKAVSDLLPPARWFAEHDFFRLAKEHPEALILWVTQECLVSTPFVIHAATVANKFADAQLRERAFRVSLGELGSGYEDWLANRPVLLTKKQQALSATEQFALLDGPIDDAHPVLLDEFRIAMGIDSRLIVALPRTAEFVDNLEFYSEHGHALEALAAFGEGNERYLLREYVAIRKAFNEIAPEVWPSLNYQNFLHANLEGDSEHSRLLKEVAVLLISGTSSRAAFNLACDIYYEAAKVTIEIRNAHYDDLAVEVEKFIRNPGYLEDLARARPLDAEMYDGWMAGEPEAVRAVKTGLIENFYRDQNNKSIPGPAL